MLKSHYFWRPERFLTAVLASTATAASVTISPASSRIGECEIRNKHGNLQKVRDSCLCNELVGESVSCKKDRSNYFKRGAKIKTDSAVSPQNRLISCKLLSQSRWSTWQFLASTRTERWNTNVNVNSTMVSLTIPVSLAKPDFEVLKFQI